MSAKYCPYCRKETEYVVETRQEEHRVRREDPPIVVEARVRVCRECGNDVSDVDLDDETLGKVYAEYRRRKGLLKPEEIRAARRRYGLSQRMFARLLGWGEATISRYEAGSLQSKAHDDLMRAVAEDPGFALRLLERGRAKIGERDYQEIRERVQAAAAGEDAAPVPDPALAMAVPAGEFTGWVRFDYEKFANAVLFFARELGGVFKSKLLKLLFYADFLSCKRNAAGITGAAYVKFPLGPVPRKYWVALEDLEEAGKIEVVPAESGPYQGEEIRALAEPDLSVYNDWELRALRDVLRRFRGTGAAEIKEASHKERAYRETGERETISYKWADELSLE